MTQQIVRPSFSASFVAYFNDPNTTLDDLFSAYWDSYKECHNIKPRWMSVWATKEEAADSFEDLSHDWVVENARQAADDQRAVEELNKAINTYIECGAGDRETALRWMTADCTFEHRQDVEQYVWELGVLFLPEGRQLVGELLNICCIVR